jgi:hypothetical protein
VQDAASDVPAQEWFAANTDAEDQAKHLYDMARSRAEFFRRAREATPCR